MSFPRAKIQRFNETPSCSPAPGTYDPKLDTRVKGPTIKKDTKPGSEGDLTPVISKIPCPTLPTFRTPQLPRKVAKGTGKIPVRERSDSSSSADDIIFKSKEISSSCPDLSELETLKNKLKDALEELNKSKKLCDSLNKDIDLKMSQIEELQCKNEMLAIEIGTLQNELDETQNKCHQSLSKFETLDRETLTNIHEINSLVNELIDRKDESFKEMFNLRAELDSLAALKSDLEQKVGQKQQMILLLQGELSSAEVELVECRSECERMTAAANEKGDEIDQLKSNIKNLELKMDDTDKQMREMRDNLMNGSVVRENMEEQLSAKQEAYSALELNYSEVVKECETLKAKYEIEVEEVKRTYEAHLESIVSNFELAANITSSNTSELQIVCNQKLAILESNIESVFTRAQTLWQNEIVALKQNVEKASQQLLEQQMAAEKKIESLNLEIDRRDKESLKRVKDVESEARIITEKLLIAEEELKKVNDIKNELKLSNVENKITMVELQDKIDMLTVENTSTADKLSIVTEERDLLKTQNKKLTVGNRNLTESLEALRIRLLESEADVEELTSIKITLESEKTNLKQELESKMTELEDCKKSIATMEAENMQQIEKVREDLLQKLETFKSEALNHSEKFNRMEVEKQAQIEDLSSQLSDFHQEFDELNKYVISMEEENRKQSLQLENFQKKHSDLEDSYSKLSSRFKILESELNKRSNELSTANGKISSQEDAILDYKCHIEQLTVDIESSKARLLELNEALTVAEESSAEHEREIEALTEKLDHQRDCAKVATQQIATLEARNSYQDCQVQTLSAELERHKEFSHQATEHMLTLVNSNTEKENQIVLISEELNELKINLMQANEECEETQTQLAERQRKLDECLEEIKLLEGDRFVKEEQLKELTLSLEHYKTLNEQYCTQISDMEKVRLERESELKEAKSRLTALEEEMHCGERELQRRIVELESVLSDTEMKEDLAQELEEARSECLKLKDVKTDLELEVHELNRKCDVMECSLSKEKMSNSELVGQISEMREELSRYQSEKTFLQHNCDNQQKLVDDLQVKVKNLNIQLMEKQNDVESVSILKEKLLLNEQNLKRLSELEKETLEWKQRYSELELLVGPFKEQLESYRAECKLLETQKGQVLDDMRELAHQYAASLGHQNHKQKIRHLVKLKDQNLELKEEVRSLKRVIEKLRKESAGSNVKSSVVTHTALVSKGKENVGHNNSPVRKSPVASPNTKPFAARPPHKNVI